jgi:hypothetical protein
MSPQRTDLVLSTDIPHVKLDILVCNSLDVESDSGDGGHVLVQLELVQNGRLSGGIESQHKEAHLLGSEDLAHHLGDLSTHFGGFVWTEA